MLHFFNILATDVQIMSVKWIDYMQRYLSHDCAIAVNYDKLAQYLAD